MGKPAHPKQAEARAFCRQCFAFDRSGKGAVRDSSANASHANPGHQQGRHIGVCGRLQRSQNLLLSAMRKGDQVALGQSPKIITVSLAPEERLCYCRVASACLGFSGMPRCARSSSVGRSWTCCLSDIPTALQLHKMNELA